MLIRIFLFGLLFCNAIAFAAAKHTDNNVKTQPAAEAITSSVNINTADVKELQKIKGIGAKRAQMIIDYRNKNGKFKSADDLTKVKGISSKRFSKLQKNNPGVIAVK